MRPLTLICSLATLSACGIGPSSDPAGGEGSDTGQPVVDSECDEDLDLFVEHLWEPVLSRRCTTCHTAGTGTAASESALTLYPDDLVRSMRSATQVADRILDKPTNRHADGHGGGEVVELGSAEAAALTWWRDFVVEGECDPPTAWTCEDAPLNRQLRRLTHAEYDRTVQELLGTSSSPGESFASDNVVDGFTNDARALVVDDLLTSQYAGAAESLAFTADLGRLLPCDPAEIGRSACAMLFIEDFGFRAFRRPLTQDDIDRYHGMWASVSVEDGFTTGLRWVVIGMLQSPHFLYRSELGVKQGDQFALTDWELASALSYTLWGGPPDDLLMDAAAAGELSTPEGLATQIERMSADARTHQVAADFVESWLHLEALKTVPRAGLDDDLRQSLRWETRQLVSDVASHGGTLDDLLLASHTFADERLAEHYGFDAPGRVELAGTTYGGLLTQGSVLTAHGRHTGSSPVQRGVVVRERLLCEPLPPPPPNVDANAPEFDPNLSTRELYAEHSSNAECAECHDLIDPIGFGFEHFDELGRFRQMDGEHPVDDSGNVDGVPFEGAQELADVLSGDPRFRACFVQTWRRHGTGADACADDPGDIGLLDPLLELPTRSGFRTRLDEDGADDTLAAGQRIDPDLPDEDITPAGSISVSMSTDDWGGGYCTTVSVTNEGDAPESWSVVVPQDGTISSHWECTYEESGSDWTFAGSGWNEVIDPGATISFGFCANRS